MRFDAEKIRERRREPALSQQEVASIAEMSLRSYADHERGLGMSPQPGTIRAIAKALQVDLAKFQREYVIHEDGEETVRLVEGLKTDALDALLDQIIAERENRKLPPLPEHIEAAVLKRAAKPLPRQG